MKTKRWLPLALAIGLSLPMLAGCKKEKPEMASTTNPAAQAAPGTFTVKMTDSPGDYAALQVEITKIEAYTAQKGWVTLSNQTQAVNVLSLTNGHQVQLAQALQLQAGVYTQLKLVFSEENFIRFNSSASLAGIHLNANGEAQLTWTTPHEVVIEINHQVNEQAGANVLLDFNVAQSITIENNQVLFHPVITEIEDVSTGVSGKVDNRAAAAILLTDGVYTYSTYMDAQGNFLLMNVDAGTYDLLVIPAGEPLSAEHRIEGVVVSNGQITQMGNIHL